MNPRHRKPKSLPVFDAALQVVRILQDAEHDALFAGGCVRDMLMGNRPDDYDIATSARPEQVVGLFRRTQEVGAKFGVVLVRLGGHAFEVATFRADVDYEDGRHPTQVRFTTAEEDAQRRDFTINGMFFDPIGEKTIDYVKGHADLDAGIIRAIGVPDERFAEDHLRMLRAIRFAARFDFRIEPTTWQAMVQHAPAISKISPERIREELGKILTHPQRARAFRELASSGLLKYLWPKASLVSSSVERTERILAALPARSNFELCLSILFHALTADVAQEACVALRCSNQTQRSIAWLHKHQQTLDTPTSVTLADLKLLMANDDFADLLQGFAARLTADGEPLAPYEAISARARAIPPEEVSPPPFVSGHDLATMSVPRGPAYARILERVYYAQLNRDVADRDAALAFARSLAGVGGT